MSSSLLSPICANVGVRFIKLPTSRAQPESSLDTYRPLYWLRPRLSDTRLRHECTIYIVGVYIHS